MLICNTQHKYDKNKQNKYRVMDIFHKHFQLSFFDKLPKIIIII